MPEEIRRFKEYLAHEYLESRFERLTYPYRHPSNYVASIKDHLVPRPEAFSAHDLSPRIAAIDGRPFNHYEKGIGISSVGLDIADDLSNVDDVYNVIRDRLEKAGKLPRQQRRKG